MLLDIHCEKRADKAGYVAELGIAFTVLAIVAGVVCPSSGAIWPRWIEDYGGACWGICFCSVVKGGRMVELGLKSSGVWGKNVE